MVECIILRVDPNYKEKACLSIYSRLVFLVLKISPNPISIPWNFPSSSLHVRLPISVVNIINSGFLFAQFSKCYSWCHLGDVQLSIVGALETFLHYHVAMYIKS